MKILEDIKLGFDDVLIVPKRSEAASRKDVDLERTFKFKHSNRSLTKFPIINSNMDVTAGPKIAIEMMEQYCFSCVHKFLTTDELTEFYDVGDRVEHVFYSLGIKKEDLVKFKDFRHRYLEVDCPNLMIDVANGYSQEVVSFIKDIREFVDNYPIIMVGNVATPNMVQELLIAGADIIKIGIGPGSQCTTREKTGIGYPQLSAIIECAEAAHGIPGGKICADGGCKTPGDVAKALGAGADIVMLGGILAGVSECDGQWERHTSYDGRGKKLWTISNNPSNTKFPGDWRLKFYGMSSKYAQEKYNGDMENYKASEGDEGYVPYKGKLKDVLNEIKGGLRSCCAYTGAKDIKALPRCTTFVKVNKQK